MHWLSTKGSFQLKKNTLRITIRIDFIIEHS